MSSVADQVVAAVIAALNAPSLPLGVPLSERDRTANLEEGDSILVYQLRRNPSRVGGRYGPLMDTKLELQVELRARGTALLSASQALDVLYVHVVKRLGGNSLGGLLSNELEEGDLVFEYGQGENPLLLGILGFTGSCAYLVAEPETRP